MLWQESKFVSVVEHHHLKYTYEYSNLSTDIFDLIVKELTILETEMDELVEETYNHRDVTIIKLQKYIDDVTKMIMHDAEKSGDYSSVHRTTDHIVVVEDIDKN